jgi:hypothetical protein
MSHDVCLGESVLISVRQKVKEAPAECKTVFEQRASSVSGLLKSGAAFMLGGA